MKQKEEKVVKLRKQDIEFILELRKHPKLHREACENPKEFAKKVSEILREEIEKENLKK
jgi:hypothetical protein